MLLLAVAVFPRSVAGPADADELHRVILAYYYAIGENRLEEAMSFYHQHSPQADEARRLLEFGQSNYLQRTSTLSLVLVRYDGKDAVILATHRHLRIAGIKFMEELVQTLYVLHRQGHAWKLWSSVERPLPH